MKVNVSAPVFVGRKEEVVGALNASAPAHAGHNASSSSHSSSAGSSTRGSRAGSRATNALGSRPGKPFFSITPHTTPPRPDSPRLSASRKAHEEAARKTANDHADTVVEQMRARLDQGQTAKAIRLIDEALSSDAVAPHPRFQWRLLKALAQAFIDPATPGDWKDCAGIAQAMQALAKRGWWNPTLKPFLFLSPDHRQALLARCDWSVRAAVMGPDIERQLIERQNSEPMTLFEVHDVVGLLNHLDRLFEDATKHQDRSCLNKVLDWAQRLGRLAGISFSRSQLHIPENICSAALDRCAHLIRRCQHALRQTQTIRVNDGLTLKLSRDWQSGTWALTTQASATLQDIDHTANEPAAFIATIDGLLADPEGPPWHLLEDCVMQGCQAKGWNADGMPWLQWRLLMAGRDGPAEERTQWLEPYITALEREPARHPSDGPGSARDRLFDTLVRLARSDWPGSSVRRALDAIHRARGWQPSASQRFSLGLAFAHRGEPQALDDLLRQGCPEDQVSQTQRLKLLEICDPKDLAAKADTPSPRPALSLEARIELLRLASPLFPERSPLRPTYEERRSSCKALRLQHAAPGPQREEGQPRLAIGSARTSQQGSPLRSAVTGPHTTALQTQQDQ